jgi:hypothetical protein
LMRLAYHGAARLSPVIAGYAPLWRMRPGAQLPGPIGWAFRASPRARACVARDCRRLPESATCARGRARKSRTFPQIEGGAWAGNGGTCRRSQARPRAGKRTHSDILAARAGAADSDTATPKKTRASGQDCGRLRHTSRTGTLFRNVRWPYSSGPSGSPGNRLGAPGAVAFTRWACLKV